MTAEEIAETLINGNISDARNAILYEHGGGFADAAILALDVTKELFVLEGEGTRSWHYQVCVDRLRRCLEGGV